ncbi:MAG: hypothetical protein D6722_08170 [Bacteroidetes bacterium]|nr:MAG: hypothetical protein D6722_08170 [Bacteroidota bacterium]
MDAEKVNPMHPGKPIFLAEFGQELNREDPLGLERMSLPSRPACRGTAWRLRKMDVALLPGWSPGEKAKLLIGSI